MGILEFSQCNWNVCVNMKAIVYKLVSVAHAYCLKLYPSWPGYSFTREIYVLASGELGSFK